MPKTFQDMLLVAQQMRVQYVWIDSLCIIQDDDSDWERESSRMADIYMNSYLTVSASTSTSSSSGCFPRRWMTYIPADSQCNGTNARRDYSSDPSMASDSLKGPKAYFYHEWMPTSTKYWPSVYRIGNFGAAFDPLKDEPLSRRGWTLQERLLSPRIIHYGKQQMYWECRKCFQAEDGAQFNPLSFNADQLLAQQRLPAKQHGGLKNWISYVEGVNAANATTPSHGRWKGGWLSVVEDYSTRSLTYGNDKLPALSGLARFLAQNTGDQYYAGLWKAHILEDLHWRVLEKQTEQLAFGPTKPTSYRAPSWSWASVDAAIKFRPLDFDRIVAEFLDCSVETPGKNPFGRVSSGRLRIRVSYPNRKRPLHAFLID
jgi:hypothetical protein